MPLMWKMMMPVIISSCICKCLDKSDLLIVEETGCRCKSRGTTDQLLINKTILADVKKTHKKTHKNLAMARMDYRKSL